MGKGAIAKKGSAPSIHSRAARRATSPGIDTDKSLKQVQPPPESVNQRPAVLAAHHSGGVTKKIKRGRKAEPSFKARRRHEKDMDRAADFMDRTAKKVQKSLGQARGLKTRRKAWDEVNKEALGVVARIGKKAARKQEEDDAVAAFYADTDEKMEEAVEEDEGEEVDVPVEGVAAVSLTEPTSIPLPPPPDDEDEVS